MASKILVVEDQDLVRGFLQTALSKRGFEVSIAVDGKAAVEALEAESFDLVLSDVKMPRMDGNELLRYMLGHFPLTPVILLTAFASIENAVEAMRSGAFDYIPKPITDLDQLEFIVRRGLSHRALLRENQELRQKLIEGSRMDLMIGGSTAMKHVFNIISHSSSTAANVLITGATGTGKELVARAIHRHSPRESGPFIQINCAAVPEALIESELFGHKKGAFTGAFETTKGKFEAAVGGSLLLDEIGVMPLPLQTKLLRAIQERVIERVGSTEQIKVDVRVIATTQVDLEKAIADGKFRQDLYYRLNVIRIKMPVLEERREDIAVLSYHFLHRYAKAYNRSISKFSDDALRYLVNAPWPGNVRELENRIERAVVMCDKEVIGPRDLLEDDSSPFSMPESSPVISIPSEMKMQGFSLDTLANIEKHHILSTLNKLNGHRLKTADALDISIRTLRNKLNQYRAEGEVIGSDSEDEGTSS